VLTALFSTCGVSLWTFVVSAVVSLPRPFSAVLVGYSLGLAVKDSELSPVLCGRLLADQRPDATVASNLINNIALGISVITTLLSGWYMRRKQQQLKVQVIRERCEQRQTAHIDPFGRADSPASTAVETKVVPGLAVPNPAYIVSTESFTTIQTPSFTTYGLV
jgi:hypothetical protein